MSMQDQVDRLTTKYVTAFQQGDAQACSDCYTDDALYLACGMAAVKGRQAIKALHEEIFESDFELIGLVTTKVESDGNLAYALQDLQAKQGNTSVMLVLRRDDAGSWRICAEAEVAA